MTRSPSIRRMTIALPMMLALPVILNGLVARAESEPEPVQLTGSFDTSSASVTCNMFIGRVAFDPPLTTTPTVTEITIKGRMRSCSVNGETPDGLRILYGRISGTLRDANINCETFSLSPEVTGELVVEWVSGWRQTLDVGTTTITPGSVTGGELNPGDAFDSNYGLVTLGGTLESPSAFGGTSPSISLLTRYDLATISRKCNGRGIRRARIAIGSSTL